MAEAKRVTILNQREGKVILPPDPEELKKNPKAKNRELPGGQALVVSAEEAVKYLRFKGIIDASTIVGTADSAEVKRLKDKLAASEAENERLRAAASDAGEESTTDDVDTGVLDAKAGVAVLLPDGTNTGVIVSVNKKKGTAQVKLDENGNVSSFDVKDLKPAPAKVAA